MNLLIPYVHLYDHNDPLLEEFTYGDIGGRARKLKRDVRKGDYVFFHTSIRGRRCITAYYVVDRVLPTAEAIKDQDIVDKYKRNPHISEFRSGERTDEAEDVMIFGDPITSRVLDRPLVFDRALAEKLSLGTRFAEGRTETQAIGSATRAWRELTDEDVTVLKKAIRRSETEVRPPQRLLSTDEVAEVIEKDIERFIGENPSRIGEPLGKSLKQPRSQLDTEVGRIDLLFDDERGNPVVVELKVGKIGRGAVGQLRRYMNWAREKSGKDVTGVMVCAGVMPAFEKDIEALEDIRIFCYGWTLAVHPRGE
jgi:hypothetical protein